MQHRNDPPGGPSGPGPFKCTQCGRGDDPPGGPPDPRPWKCSHCNHDFEGEMNLKWHLRRTNCQYPHTATQKPGKGRTWDLQWSCPRCKAVLRSKYSADRHVKNLCWKICDECNTNGEFEACSLQQSDHVDSACTNCTKKGISCTTHTGPIVGDPVPVPRRKPHVGDHASQEKDNRNRTANSPPVEQQPKKSRTGGQLEAASEPLEVNDDGYNLPLPHGNTRAPSRSVYLTPQEPEVLELWVPKGKIFDPSDIPLATVPPNKPQQSPTVPSFSTTEALGQAHAARGATTQPNVSAGVVPSSPQSPLSPDDPQITIHIRNVDRSAQQDAQQTIILSSSEVFGPHLNQYCEYFGQQFQQDWVFVWYSADPLPGDEDNVRGTVIHWHYTPSSFGPPRFPRMGAYEYFYIFRSNDERVRNVLRVDFGDQAALSALQHNLREDSEDTQLADPYPHRGGNGRPRQELSTSAGFEYQAQAGSANETQHSTGQRNEEGFLDDDVYNYLYDDPY